MIRNAIPAAKLTALTRDIITTKPVRLSERCGVKSAVNISGSAAPVSKSLPAVIANYYTSNMAKIIRPQRAKKSVVRAQPKPSAKRPSAAPALKSKAGPKSDSTSGRAVRTASSTATTKGAKSTTNKSSTKPSTNKPWTEAEIYEAFSRFRQANPEPKGELEHLNPFTLLVAVVLAAQATDAGVTRATPALFQIADTPQKMLALGEDSLRDHIKSIGLYRTKA